MNTLQTEVVVPGSLAERAISHKTSLALEFLSVEVVALVDVSGSMDARDTRDYRTRYNVACEELAKVQAERPGKVAVYAFSDECAFHPGGVPAYEGNGTDLAKGLRTVHKVSEAAGRLVIISDGYPDSETDALAEAEKFTCRIDTVYCGAEEQDGGGARAFLQRLARVGKGQSATAMHADGLGETLLLLESARG